MENGCVRTCVSMMALLMDTDVLKQGSDSLDLQ